MVLPILGRALMGAGADIAGSSAARSSAGKILSSGKGTSLKEWNQMKEIGTNAKGILKGVMKIANTLAKASPMFAQQLQIIDKSLKLFLRPIGDILAKFVRPMAIAMLKFAIKWNELFGSGTGDNNSKTAKEDALEQAKKERTSAIMRGDVPGRIAADEKISKLENQLEEPTGFAKGMENMEKAAGQVFDNVAALFETDNWKNLGKGIIDNTEKLGNSIGDFAKDIWDNYIVKGWESVLTWAQNIWDTYIVKGWEGILTWAKDIWDNYIVKAWEGILTWSKDIWDNYVVKGWKGMLTWADDIWKKYISPIWEAIKSAAKKLIDKAKPGVEKVAETVGKVVEKVWNKAKQIWEEVTTKPKEKAVGGPVQTTGLYNLHAGERIMTAGDTARSKATGSSTTVNNYISLNAQVSSEIDIRTLARRLAEYSETEIRRRVSYT